MISHAGKGNIKIVPFPSERKKIDIGDFYGSSEKLEEVTGWHPKIFLDEGLRLTVEYYQKNFQYYL